MQLANPMSSVSKVWSTSDAEKLIVMMARVSAPKNQKNTESSPRLIRYLIENQHWSFQEFSQRYANTGEMGKPVIPHLRSQDYKNRQNSIDDLPERLGKGKLSDYYRRISILFEDAEHLYQEMVSDGVAKECARAVLPLACPTRMYMTGTLRSWIHYIQLRTGNGTQMEHKLIAEDCKTIFKREYPIISEAVWPHE
jgi:thymidylate synthase (FAD)